MVNLALLYLNGQGVPKDEKKGFELIRKAAEAGAVDAQFQMAVDYDGGYHGVKQDKAIAIEWFRKAAEQGMAIAQYDLAMEIHEQADETYFWLSIALPNLIEKMQNQATYFRNVAAAALSPAQRAEIDKRIKQWQDAHQKKP